MRVSTNHQTMSMTTASHRKLDRFEFIAVRSCCEPMREDHAPQLVATANTVSVLDIPPLAVFVLDPFHPSRIEKGSNVMLDSTLALDVVVMVSVQRNKHDIGIRLLQCLADSSKHVGCDTELVEQCVRCRIVAVPRTRLTFDHIAKMDEVRKPSSLEFIKQLLDRPLRLMRTMRARDRSELCPLSQACFSYFGEVVVTDCFGAEYAPA